MEKHRIAVYEHTNNSISRGTEAYYTNARKNDILRILFISVDDDDINWLCYLGKNDRPRLVRELDRLLNESDFTVYSN